MDEEKTYLRSIAHDMRTPLSVLKSYIAYRRGKCDAEEEEYRQAAENSVDKLLSIVEAVSARAKQD